MSKEIEKFIASMDNLYKFQLDEIKRGDSSYLNNKYRLDIDNVERRYCFRSEHNFDGFKCDNIDLIEEISESKFNKMVNNSEIEYQDIEMYEYILNQVKKVNGFCANCIKNNNNICRIETSRAFLEDTLSQREKYKFKPTANIKEFHNFMMSEMKDAIENRASIFRSYSKSLAVPLFKYVKIDNSLYINLLDTNTVEAEITANCFDWFDTYDENGDKNNRYYSSIIQEDIPLKFLASNDKCTNSILDELRISEMFNYMDIDSIDLLIKNVTLDVSNLNRNTLSTYFNQYIKTYASYKSDLEVLTTKQEPIYAISDSKTLQLIRYIYLLRISDCFTDKVFSFVNDIYTGIKYTDKIDISNSKEGFLFIWNYMLSGKNIRFEREHYFKLFDFKSKYYSHLYFEGGHRQGLVDFLNKLMSNSYSNIFDKHFLEWLIKCSGLLE